MNIDKITKKDLCYIIAILICVIVSIFTIKLGDNQNVINYFGFAGTLISIILAVVALIYSFYQSSTYENSTSKLDNSANKIEEATLKLESVSDIKEVTSELQETYTQLNMKVHEIQNIIKTVDKGISEFAITVKENLETFTNTVEVKFNNIHESVEFTKRDILKELSFKQSTKSDKTVDSKIMDEEDDIIKFMEKFNSNQLVFIYYFYCVHKLKLTIDFNDFIKWIVENDISSWSEAWKAGKDERYLIATVGYFMAIIRLIENNGLINLDADLNVLNMDEHLCEYLIEKELEQPFIKLNEWARESYSISNQGE
ncbi:UNVERIFIED_CONTAM: flagellar biosynthesis chaperone FliJ [Brevibacillus sp. OAP136]